MFNENSADAMPLMAGQHVRVANQVHVAHVLHSHDANQFVIDLATPEFDACIQVSSKFQFRHVRLVPAVLRNHSAIGLRGRVDVVKDRCNFLIATGTYAVHGVPLCLRYLRASLAPAPSSVLDEIAASQGDFDA